MVLKGQVSYAGDGFSISTRGMMIPMTVLNIHTDNIANFGIPGYQRKDPIVTSFVEHLGSNGIDKVTNTEIGRLRLSGNPFDLALNNQGYFQKLTASGGIELTRDGRFKLDKEGFLLSSDGKKILSQSGTPLRFPIIPNDAEKEMKIASDGTISVYNPKKGTTLRVGQFSIVNSDGTLSPEVDVKQGYVEDSNVYLAKEFVGILPLRRQFEANRQLFILQSDSLSRMIQELGRTQ